MNVDLPLVVYLIEARIVLPIALQKPKGYLISNKAPQSQFGIDQLTSRPQSRCQAEGEAPHASNALGKQCWGAELHLIVSVHGLDMVYAELRDTTSRSCGGSVGL